MTNSSLTLKNVLIVDDDASNVLVLTHLLKKRNAAIITATNGLEALEKLRENSNIHIVLMDIMMPKMNGYEAIAEIRKLEQYHFLPIIALTANTTVGDKQKCLDAGASDYMNKPVNKAELVAKMKIWLKEKSVPISFPRQHTSFINRGVELDEMVAAQMVNV